MHTTLELFLLNSTDHKLISLNDFTDSFPEFLITSNILLQKATKYKEFLTTGNLLFAADGENARYIVSYENNKFTINEVNLSEKRTFYKFYYSFLENGIDCWYGYVKEKKYTIEKSIQHLVDFLMLFKNERIVITNKLDLFILSYNWGFVEKCPDQEFLIKELLPVLIPAQMKE